MSDSKIYSSVEKQSIAQMLNIARYQLFNRRNMRQKFKNVPQGKLLLNYTVSISHKILLRIKYADLVYLHLNKFLQKI